MAGKKYSKRIRLGKIQRKALLLIGGSLLLGMSRSPQRYFQILKALREEWHNISKQSLERALGSLSNLKLITEKMLPNGEISFEVSNVGERYALEFSIDEIKIQTPVQWDRKWRIVLFDIPEKRKKIRDSLRFHLKKLHFYELQKSVFVVPYDCKSEIEFITIFYRIGKNIRFIVADSIDNEIKLRNHFHLPAE